MSAPSIFVIGELYTGEEIQHSLGVGNAGGLRVSIGDNGEVRRIVVMTSSPTARLSSENPYHDRIEGSTLVYTGAGREGDQSLAGANQRIPQQRLSLFPIYGFLLIGSRRDTTIGPRRWRFLGLLEYLKHYAEAQVDVRLKQRRVWLFEFHIHFDPAQIPVAHDIAIAAEIITSRRALELDDPRDREVEVPAVGRSEEPDATVIESVRGKMLALTPQGFEHLVSDALLRSGFARVEVTRYSQDGGIDVNAYAGNGMWPIRDVLVQIQAKRWLHSVGRKEVAELRGSLRPYGRGAVVTTSHFSRAAIGEAQEAGKAPIVLVDGFAFAAIVHSLHIAL